MKRDKIYQGYYQSGYGRGLKKAPIIYLIDSKLYAKDKAGWECSFKPLEGHLKGYVRINKMNDNYYYEVSLDSDHESCHYDIVHESYKAHLKTSKSSIYSNN